MSHLADLSAVELVSSYKAKALSPVEVTEAVIGRIEAYEPKLNALWAYDPEAARLAAKASEARWAKGEPAGPIDGVPLTIKENIATKGTPVPLGCAALPLKPAAADAPPAARTREAGGRAACQDHHARSRHVVVGPVEFSQAGPQSVGYCHQSRRFKRWRGKCRRRRLRPAPYRHGYWRLRPPVCRLVRSGRPEAILRAHSHRSAVSGARCRAYDAHCGR
ncbi:hypothetical protein C066_02526 [Brucella sp. UK5/01]|nr:hypothetical protein C066_02526 [Brucella sp. UK5/01]ENT20639.1 hypothetical protein C051_02483 [Brucella sp. UK40/99]